MNRSDSLYYFAPRVGIDRAFIVGLVNNTSDRGLHATEAQFMRVLRGAAGDKVILRCFTCPEVSRATTPRTAAGERYLPFEQLFNTRLDALIVTGMEPQAIKLQNEPIWPSLVKLVDWAEACAVPAIWSCLAAHAAVFHLDGISRVPMAKKLSGVFDCETTSDHHPLTDGLELHRVCPHSRHFDLPEASLVANGYKVLSRSPQAGVDTFIRMDHAPVLFFQGHPEYETGSLSREYMRDIGRYARGESEEYPNVPTGYFPEALERTLTTLQLQALDSNRPAQLMETVSNLLGGALPNAQWYGPAERIYANWLGDIARIENGRCAGESWRKFPTAQAVLPQ